MTTIYINLGATTNTAPAPWDDNYGDNTDPTTVGVIIADLLDDVGSLTGIGWENTIAYTAVAGGSGTATAGAGGWPEQVFDIAWYGDGAGKLTGLTNGDSYTIEVAGHNGNGARDTDFTVDGTTTLYDASATSIPNPPISFSGTISGTELAFSQALVSAFAYVNGYKIIITPAATGPSITTIAPDPAITGAELTTTGTGFRATQGTGGVTQEQGAVVVPLTINTWGDTSITADSATVESTGLKYGTQTLKVTHNSGASDTKTFVATPLAGNDYETATSIATVGQLVTAAGTLVIGTQVRYQAFLHLNGVPTTKFFKVNPDMTYTVDGTTPDGVYTAEVRAFDNVTKTWGAIGVQTIPVGVVVGVVINSKLSIGLGIGI